jgi:hypothetical protein
MTGQANQLSFTLSRPSTSIVSQHTGSFAEDTLRLTCYLFRRLPVQLANQSHCGSVRRNRHFRHRIDHCMIEKPWNRFSVELHKQKASGVRLGQLPRIPPPPSSLLIDTSFEGSIDDPPHISVPIEPFSCFPPFLRFDSSTLCCSLNLLYSQWKPLHVPSFAISYSRPYHHLLPRRPEGCLQMLWQILLSSSPDSPLLHDIQTKLYGRFIRVYNSLPVLPDVGYGPGLLLINSLGG